MQLSHYPSQTALAEPHPAISSETKRTDWDRRERDVEITPHLNPRNRDMMTCCRPLPRGSRGPFEAGVVNIWKRAMSCLVRNRNWRRGHPKQSTQNPKWASALQNQCRSQISGQPAPGTKLRTKPGRTSNNHENSAPARAGAPGTKKVGFTGLRPLPPTPKEPCCRYIVLI